MEHCEDVISELASNSTEDSRHKRAVSNSSSTEIHQKATDKKVALDGDDEKDNGKKVEHKKHHSHHGSHEHSSHGHGHHHGSNDDRKSCLRKLSHKRSQCRTLTRCCTETKM